MHNLVVGVSGSGKSWLAKRIAADHAGANIIVYDPLQSGGWPQGARKFSGPAIFLDYIERDAQSAYVFVDEARTLWTFDQDRADRAVYTGRHRGLLFFLIAQRTRMIPPNARNCCQRIYSFRQQMEDARILAGEYHDALTGAANLEKLHFIASDGFDVRVYYLDFAHGTPPAYYPIGG